jgi:hypothetical protein
MRHSEGPRIHQRDEESCVDYQMRCALRGLHLPFENREGWGSLNCNN